MTDGLTRWSIALGVGAVALMGALGGFYAAAGDAQRESFRSAIDQLVPERASFDATVELDTYDLEEYGQFADLLQRADVERTIDCGGYEPIGGVFHPAHVCTADAHLTDALTLFGANADVVRDDYTLTVGKYRSPYEDILLAADTVRIETASGTQNVTYEGGGTFALTFLERAPSAATSEPWQFALASVPYGVIWLTALAVGGIATVVASVLIRQRREQAVETVGVEFFDGKL